MKIKLLFLCLLSGSFFYGQTINIPDPNFKQALLNQDMFARPPIDTNNDGEIQVSEALAIDTLIVGDAFVNLGIQDMTGIEAFENITYLMCYNNQITTMDLSQNLALEELDCQQNQLTSLDLSNNTLLKYLDCYNNQVSFLNVRNGNNQNISNEHFRTSSNPNLICIFVDDKAYSQNNWLLVDPNSNFVETQQECDDLGLGSNKKLNIKVYPNPVKNKLFIEAENKSNLHYTLYSLTGKQLKQGQMFPINMQDQATGIYFIQLTQNHQSHTYKIIKEY